MSYFVVKTSRPNAGGPLYVPARLDGNRVVECDLSPSHDRRTAQRMADDLNRRSEQPLPGEYE